MPFHLLLEKLDIYLFRCFQAMHNSSSSTMLVPRVMHDGIIRRGLAWE